MRIPRMNKSEIAAELYRQQFSVGLSKRYHAHRIAFHRAVSIAAQSIEFFVSSSVLLSLLDDWPTLRTAALALAALVAGLSIAHGAAKRIEAHATKKAQFAELARRFPVDPEAGTEEELRAIRDRREEIEADDNLGFPCLDLICHNEECFSRGLESDMKPMTWAQRNLGAFVPLPYRPRGGVRTTPRV